MLQKIVRLRSHIRQDRLTNKSIQLVIVVAVNITHYKSPIYCTAMVKEQYHPDELLQKISGELKLSPGVGIAVMGMDEICKSAFYRLAKPVLYHIISGSELFKLTHYLALNHILADEVRELSVTPSGWEEMTNVFIEDEVRQ
jgi:hypothetical protein